jgi:solute carrier family 25 aspartate/glutamate transporter 12/13
VAAEGYAGLYRGLKPNLIGVTPEKALKLTVNDTMREYFKAGNGDGKIRLWQEMASGALAGFLQVAATNPMEIVKLRMQLQGESGALPKSAMATINDLGARGLYKGTVATWMRDVPFSIAFFTLFANLKTAFDGNNSMLGLFAAGAIAGSCSAGLVTPFDVIKTRLQVVGSKYTGIGHAVTTILKEEGPGAFLKGLAPRMTVQAPLFGITLFAFDLLKRNLAKRQAEAAAQR